MKIGAIERSQLAKIEQEYLALLASDADWFARSEADVQALRDAKEGPIAKLSEEAYNQFFNSLMFSQGGLATMNYQPLMKELTLKEMGDVFGNFGIDLSLAQDHDNNRCTSPHNCTPASWCICMSNC